MIVGVAVYLKAAPMTDVARILSRMSRGRWWAGEREHRLLSTRVAYIRGDIARETPTSSGSDLRVGTINFDRHCPEEDAMGGTE